MSSVGKNQALKREKTKWKSDVPLTDGQLRSKRDEFWDTAPAFEGRKEIWDALKAAAYAAETNDYDLAQAIIDGACISLPNGSLTDSYDELGNRYQLPIYCISAPVNLVESTESNSPSPETEAYTGGAISGEEILIKLRVSSLSNDIKMGVFSKESVASAKRRLCRMHGLPEAKDQRWYFGGRLLHDRLKIQDIKLQQGFVVQVVVSPQNS
jgi:hypothetical protein